MTPQQVVDYFGGDTASIPETAKQLDITYQAISQWFAAGKVPRGRQFEIQDLTNGALKVDESFKKKVA